MGRLSTTKKGLARERGTEGHLRGVTTSPKLQRATARTGVVVGSQPKTRRAVNQQGATLGVADQKSPRVARPGLGNAAVRDPESMVQVFIHSIRNPPKTRARSQTALGAKITITVTVMVITTAGTQISRGPSALYHRGFSGNALFPTSNTYTGRIANMMSQYLLASPPPTKNYRRPAPA